MRIICNEQRQLEIDNEYGKSTDSKMERKNDEQTETCLTIYLFRYIAIAHYLISSSIYNIYKHIKRLPGPYKSMQIHFQ